MNAIVKVFTGNAICTYCNERMNELEPHPPRTMFVNGYPSLCPHTGKIPIYNIASADELPWALRETTVKLYYPDCY